MINPLDLGSDSTELSPKNIKGTPFFTPSPPMQRDFEGWEKVQQELSELREQTEKLVKVTYSLSRRVKQLEVKVWGKEQK